MLTSLQSPMKALDPTSPFFLTLDTTSILRTENSSCGTPAMPEDVLNLPKPVESQLSHETQPLLSALTSCCPSLLHCDEDRGWLFPSHTSTLSSDCSSTTFFSEFSTNFCGVARPAFTSQPINLQRLKKSPAYLPSERKHSYVAPFAAPSPSPVEPKATERIIPSSVTYSISVSPVDNIINEKARPKSCDTRLNLILSLTTLDRHQNNARKCTASLSRDQGRRCSKNAISSIDTEVLRSCLIKATMLEEQPRLFDALDRLVGFVLCNGGHHIKRARENLSQLKNELGHSAGPVLQDWIRAMICDRTTTPAEPTNDENPTIPTSSPSVTEDIRISNVRTRSQNKNAATSTHETDRPTKILPTASEKKLRTRVIAPPVYRSYTPKKHFGRSTSSLIREQLHKPLTKTELKEDFVYVFWYIGNFGLVKIGVTKDVKGRFKAWENQCGHPVQECLDQEMSSKVKVRHAYRLEKLIQAELREFRVEELHCRCGKKHREWFKTSAQHVKAVIKKWTDFISEKDRYEHRIGGALIEENTDEGEVQRLCQPIKKPDDFTWTPTVTLKFRFTQKNVKRRTIAKSCRRSARKRGFSPDADGFQDNRKLSLTNERSSATLRLTVLLNAAAEQA